MTYWKRDGKRRGIAAATGISENTLSDILHRRRSISIRMAMRLQETSGIAAKFWVRNLTTNHPAFFGAPKLPRGGNREAI